MIRLCMFVLFMTGLASSFAPITSLSPHLKLTELHLFGSGASGGRYARIPKSTNDRDNQAISSIKIAIQKSRSLSYPYIECEFPVLNALNKLGDGSLRSTLEAEEANIAFVNKVVKGLAPAPFLGPNVSLLVSGSASNSFLSKVKKNMKGSIVYSLKDGFPDVSKDEVCIFVTPSSRGDFQAAKALVESGTPVVVINAFAKDQKSIPGRATMGYFLKPLTYNSQVAGFLIRSYPSDWTVIDAFSNDVLGSFSDQEILVRGTNTPDLRQSGRLVQRSVDERAIRERQR